MFRDVTWFPSFIIFCWGIFQNATQNKQLAHLQTILRQIWLKKSKIVRKIEFLSSKSAKMLLRHNIWNKYDKVEINDHKMIF